MNEQMKEAHANWPTVSILVLNWNGRDLLQRYLPPLTQLDYPGEYHIVLVDNGSTDDSLAFVQSHFPQIQIIANEGNLGFSRGMNRGLRQAAAAITVLLNTDVEVRPNWLTELVRPMLADAAIGITGSKLYFPDGRTLQHAGAMLERPLAIGRHRFYRQIDNGQAAELAEVDYVTGAAMAIRREVLDTIGLLDEAFSPFYYEEVDFCTRARASGFRVIYVPDSVALHYESLSISQIPERQYYDLNRNRLYYVLKHEPPAQFLVEFLPAEKANLEQLTHRHQVRLMGRAYRDMVLVLSEFNLSPAERQAIQQGLLALAQWANVRQSQMREGKKMMNEEVLLSKADVQERPFTSPTPLIGPFLAWFRTQWNNISTTWYVRPLLAQQNEYNRLLVQTLAPILQQLSETGQEQDGRLIAQDQDQVIITRHMAELTMQIKQMNQRLAQLEESVNRKP